jgi:hypothetical protein
MNSHPIEFHDVSVDRAAIERQAQAMQAEAARTLASRLGALLSRAFRAQYAPYRRNLVTMRHDTISAAEL